MIVLQEGKENWQQQHFAFSVDRPELDGLKTQLESNSIAVDGPVNLEWMSALSLYFSDPDGHSLEFIVL